MLAKLQWRAHGLGMPECLHTEQKEPHTWSRTKLRERCMLWAINLEVFRDYRPKIPYTKLGTTCFDDLPA